MLGWIWWALITLVLFIPALSVLILQRIFERLAKWLQLLYDEICDFKHFIAPQPNSNNDNSKYDEDI